MANGELIDAREAMQVLGIGEGDLQNLVARGDLRAFRSAGTMKFRRDDVMNLKTEKGTEPTIIIPPAGARKPGQSGILGPAHVSPAAPAAAPSSGGDVNQTGPIVLDEIELQMPADEGMATQQQTVVSAPVGGAGGTVIEAGSGQTGEMTVVDQAAEGTAPAPAVAATGSGRRAAQAKTGSRVGSGVAPGPAVSRVRLPAAGARRTATVYERKTSHPFWTSLLVVNAAVMLFTLSIFGVILFVGSYDYDPVREVGSRNRIIPPYLKQLGVYEGFYDGSFFGRLPGRPQDPLPESAPDRVTTPPAR